MKQARSDGPTAAAASGGSSDPSACNASQSTAGTAVITASVAPATTTACSSGSAAAPSPVAMSATRDAKSPWTTITRAPESVSTWRRNSPLYAVLIGTWTAPSFSAAKKLITCSGEFSMSVATRSPRPTPSPASPWAIRLAARSTSRAVSATPSKSRYRPSGSSARRPASASRTVVSGEVRVMDLTLPSPPRTLRSADCSLGRGARLPVSAYVQAQASASRRRPGLAPRATTTASYRHAALRTGPLVVYRPN